MDVIKEEDYFSAFSASCASSLHGQIHNLKREYELELPEDQSSDGQPSIVTSPLFVKKKSIFAMQETLDV